jgi:hypothetical protein
MLASVVLLGAGWKTALQAVHRPPTGASSGDRRNRPRILQATFTKISVVCKPLKKNERGFDDRTSPSAKTPCRDILFPWVHRGRKPAEYGHFRRIVRTTMRRLLPHCRPFSASLRPLSPKQPNHGHFGTDVESSIIQWVGGPRKGSGFENAPPRRSEPGSNCLVR